MRGQWARRSLCPHSVLIGIVDTVNPYVNVRSAITALAEMVERRNETKYAAR